jgi:two-component system, NarL family, sensor histidine kinase UhpB
LPSGTRARTQSRLIKTAAAQRKENDVNSLLITYVNLSEHYASAGQTEKSVKYMQKFYELQDSLTDVKTQIELHNMEGQYNVEKKEKEIALLKKDQQLSHANLEKQTAILTAQKAVLAKQKFFEYGAVLLLVLLTLIGFLVINRYRILHRARRAIELEKMRNHIARDLHDDIGSTLSSINILSKVALQSPSPDGPQSTLAKIRDRSAAIMEKMDDIVWTINPQNDTMEQLLYRMKEFAAEILEPLNINYSFQEDGDFPSMKLDIRKRKDLYLVFKEAINNAAKYSQCSNLLIRLRREGDSLQMEITDDGKGFAAETAKGGNGLNNMHERAASMLGKLRIDSAVGEGTRVGLDLPIT